MKNLFTSGFNKTDLLKSFVFLLVTMFSGVQAHAGITSALEAKNKAESLQGRFLMANRKVLVGGDISLDFVASAPLTYNHHTGGGAFDDRTIGRNLDVVESLEGGDFKCGDHVSYLTKITVGAGASASSANKTIQLDYSFLAAATGQPGVALGSFGDVKINYGAIGMGAGDGTGGTDSGMHDDGGSVASLSNNMVNGTLFIKPATLTGTVTITDLEPGEVVILRVDVIIACNGQVPTGNLQASLPSGRIMGVSGKNGSISVGQQTVPFKNVAAIQQGSCNLIPDYVSVCEGDIQHYTLTTNGIPAWSLTGDGIFTDATGLPLLNNDPGTALEVYVKASAPSTLKGSYNLIVNVNSIVTPTSCSDQVDVYKTPDKPIVMVTAGVAPLCGTATLPSLQVCSPIQGITYYLQNASGAAVANITPDAINPDVIFSDLVSGSGFRVYAKNNTCVSDTAKCGDEVSTCTPAKIGTSAIKPQFNNSKQAAQDLVAFPVPFSDKVTVKFTAENAENYVINLYNMQGQLVRELKAGSARAGEVIQIPVSGKGMSESMYLVRKISKSGVSTVKLLKSDK